MARTGRPSTKWSDANIAQAYRLAMLGLTDAQIAKGFDVSERTLNTWKKKHPELLQSIKKGKLPADGNVAISLYQRAIGFSQEEEVVRLLANGTVVRATVRKRYPPDTIAAIFWLKNRQRDKWYDMKSQEPPPVASEANAAKLVALLRALDEQDVMPPDAPAESSDGDA